ncbi:hypothetical protein B4135_4181 [Caldibacillus debilis]|uniref:Uncharacterized protein n=1 Tax=Caldibacillus debilis TaxID=301148 RepID=A0A150L6Y0_9BACI|nr:hypothetical protein B4135_4181 [Caldibacillus debilis]
MGRRAARGEGRSAAICNAGQGISGKEKRGAQQVLPLFCAPSGARQEIVFLEIMWSISP